MIENEIGKIDSVDHEKVDKVKKTFPDQKDDCQDVPLIYVLSALYLKKDGKIKTVKTRYFDNVRCNTTGPVKKS